MSKKEGGKFNVCAISGAAWFAGSLGDGIYAGGLCGASTACDPLPSLQAPGADPIRQQWLSREDVGARILIDILSEKLRETLTLEYLHNNSKPLCA